MQQAPKMKTNKLTKAQYLVRKKQIFDKQGLSQTQRIAKYKQYANSQRRIAVITTNNIPRNQVIPKPSLKKMTPTVRSLPECTLAYASILTNPFNDAINEACIPDAISVQSYKFSSIAMGVCTTNASGFAFVAFNPWTMSGSNFSSNNVQVDYPLYTTKSTYPLQTARFIGEDVQDQYTIGYNGNTLLTGEQIAKGQIRLVGAGVQIYYTGQKLIQSGVVTSLQNDGMKGFDNETPLSLLQKNPRSYTCSVSSDNPCNLTYTPTDFEQLSYKNIIDFTGSGIYKIGEAYYPLLMMISGAAPNVTFQIRAKAYFEAQLPGMPATPSHADPQGMAQVLSAKSNLAKGDTPENDFIHVIRSAARTLAGFAPQIGGAIGTALGQPELGLQGGTLTKRVIESLL